LNIRYCITVLAGMAFVLLCGPVEARPRDEVMSRAFRCATIGESRTWLDCYYGAAQPARAALGMPPAPPSQIKLVSAPPVGAPIPADLLVRDETMQGAVRCDADDRQWLDCYYAAAQPMRAKLGLSTLSRASKPVLSAPGLTPPVTQAFGRKPVVQDGDLDHVTTRMQSYSFDKLGWFTATLDNGQVWYQVHGDTTFAKNWKKPASRYLVHISHGFLNSYNLQVRGLPGLYKVLREDR
jgi:hypothetical protein